MKKISILLLVLWGVIPSMLFAQRQLSFQNGKFKIVQFTDLHWTSGSPKCAETERTIRTILKSENPDIAILTGDIVTEAPAINGWMSVVEIFNNAKVPFVVTMGNHDAEHMAKDSICKQSAHFASCNNGRPLPSLAFFHIPLLEYNELIGDGKTFGNDREGGVASSKVNSGIFASFLDRKDVMGVFAGHDHDNDYVGINKRILLGYGRVTGADAYGELIRGARIIELYEGEFKFDTWIATLSGREAIYYYPSGLNSDEERVMNYFPAMNVASPKQGVAYTYYEGQCKRVADITSCLKVKEGIMKNFLIKDAAIADHFAYEFRTLIYISKRGVYRFYTISDDGSKLYIDDKLIVDNDGGHSVRRAEGKVALEKGYHALHLLYFENYMGQELEVGFLGRDIPETPIPAEMLFLPD